MAYLSGSESQTDSFDGRRVSSNVFAELGEASLSMEDHRIRLDAAGHISNRTGRNTAARQRQQVRRVQDVDPVVRAMYTAAIELKVTTTC